MVRPKTMTKYCNFPSRRGLEFVRDWLNVRREVAGPVIGISREAEGRSRARSS